MPTEHDDDDHDVMTAAVSTATVSPVPTETGLLVIPSDHPDRPVKPTAGEPHKPSGTAAASASSGTGAAASATGTSPGTFLPHYFPTFGVSKRTQIWIYGALAIIILFCIGLGAYFLIQRRRRLRNSRDVYEFEAVGDGDNIGLSGGARGRRTKRRAGELYDAFAGESDEELLTDDEEATAYRDNEVESVDRGRSPMRRSDSGES